MGEEMSKDYLYFETDDSCAICGIRGKEILTVHHIDEDRTNNVYENLIVLCGNCHGRCHQPRGTLTRDDIEKRKMHLIHKTITQYGINALKIADRNDFGVIAMPFLLHHLVGLDFMTQEETQMTYGEIEATARFTITDRGKEMLKRYFK